MSSEKVGEKHAVPNHAPLEQEYAVPDNRQRPCLVHRRHVAAIFASWIIQQYRTRETSANTECHALLNKSHIFFEGRSCVMRPLLCESRSRRCSPNCLNPGSQSRSCGCIISPPVKLKLKTNRNSNRLSMIMSTHLGDNSLPSA